MSAIKTFFRCNGFSRENGRELRLEKYRVPPRTIVNEYVPTLREALTMAERAGCKRNRAIDYTLLTTGLRNTALRALCIRDIHDELARCEFPLLIKIEESWNKRIPGACKNGIPYYTFIAKIGAESIQSMLRERTSIFGEPELDEPLFISNYNQIPLNRRRIKILSPGELLVIVHKTARAADILDWNHVRVHSIRKSFESVLRSPLDDGTSMDQKDQEFLMGHILPGSQENYYDRSKVERLRDLYSKLVFEDRPTSKQINREVTDQMARMLKLDLPSIILAKETELGRKLVDKEAQEALEDAIKTKLGTTAVHQQKMVTLPELQAHLDLQWEVASPLPDGRVVIRKRES
jgi:integrase